MEYISSVLWEKGLREANEDAYCLQQISISGALYGLAVVCDGIGGLSEGENASSMVAFSLRGILDELTGISQLFFYKRRVKSFLSRKLFGLHHRLLSYGEKKGILLGTTCSLLYFYGNRYILCSIGDSRIYYGRKKLALLTADDTDLYGRVTRAVGVGKWHRIAYKCGKFQKGYCMYLCSDGMYRKQSKYDSLDIKNIMGARMEEELYHHLQRIYEIGINLGETDNCTGILIKRI